jgi:hypothetical protein
MDELLRTCRHEDFITRTAGNGVPQKWMRVVAVRPSKGLQKWSNFLHDTHDDTIREYCRLLGGSEEHGIRLLAHRLMKINSQAATLGVRDGGGAIIEVMSAERTAGFVK